MRICGTEFLLLLFGFICVRVKDVDSESCPVPVFSPSSLVVKFGDPAFASCSICNGSCDSDLALQLEEPLSSKLCDGSVCIWNVTRVSLWSLRPICYIFDSSCLQTTLTVTVYKPPDRVTLSFEELPLVEGNLYSLQCEVEAVAPARLLTVTFYKNHIELGSRSGLSPLKSPVNQSLSLDYTVSREDHGALFYCEARLELGPGGPQRPPVVQSQNITANVHFSEEQVEAPPTRPSREHAGKPTVFAQSQRGQRQHPEETAARQHPEETAPKAAGFAPGSSVLITLALLLLHFSQWL